MDRPQNAEVGWRAGRVDCGGLGFVWQVGSGGGRGGRGGRASGGGFAACCSHCAVLAQARVFSGCIAHFNVYHRQAVLVTQQLATMLVEWQAI